MLVLPRASLTSGSGRKIPREMMAQRLHHLVLLLAPNTLPGDAACSHLAQTSVLTL